LLALQRKISGQMRAKQVAAAQGVLAETRPVSLDFREANLRSVLDLVSRNSGINFVLDKDIRADARVTVYLKNAKVEDALDFIISSNQLAKKILDSRTIAIYPNTPEKQKDYQEQIVRVFYLAGSDAKNAAAFLKSMLKIKDPFVEERINMLAIRDSQENIQLAEKLIALFDAGEPEVLLEVEVLEVSSKRMLQLGVNPPTSFSLSLLRPLGASGWDLSNIGWVRPKNIGVNVGNATVDFKSELGDFTTLANPRIRVRNKEKASVMVGDKIPVVATTTGVGGFVSDTVTYLDVGLKLTVEPTIYADDDVAVKVGLEVSTLGASVQTKSGTLAYQIGTRNATTLLRLQDGETQMLAGLISRNDHNSATGLPGATDLPILGRLLSGHQDSSNKTELVLAITPRILRNIRKPEAQESELWVGTEAAPKLRPYGGLRPDLSAAKLDSEKSTNPKPTDGANASANASPAQRDANTPARASPAITWIAPTSAKVGEIFDVNIGLKSDTPVRGLHAEIAVDSTKLQLIDAKEGEFFNQSGAATSFSKGTPDASGKLALGLMRHQATGAMGQGIAYRLKYKALVAGPVDLLMTKFTPMSLGGPVPEASVVAPHTIQVTP
jgi:general secretion pathway protein D